MVGTLAWVQGPFLAAALRYAEEVCAGAVPATAALRHAAGLFMAELKEPERHGVRWEEARLEWLQARAQVLGMTLQPWQWFAAAVLLARRRADDGGPATLYFLLTMGRGGGKTGFVALVIDAFMAPGNDALIAVMSTSQAKSNETWERLRAVHQHRAAWSFSGGGDRAIGRCDYQKARLRCFPMKATHFDAIVPTLIYLDEAARMDEGVNRAISAAAKHPSCQLIITTTPDKDQHGRQVWAYWNACQKAALNGEPFPAGWFMLEYSTEPGDNPLELDTLRKAQPSVGVLTRAQTSLDQIRTALDSGEPKVIEEVYTQNLATFYNAGGTALPLEVIDRASRAVDDAEFNGLECIVAIDFSQGGECVTNSQCDLTSMQLMAWNGKHVISKGWHWWAGGSVENDEKRTGMPLREWASGGLITLCPGPTIEYPLLEARLQWLYSRYNVLGIVADPAGKATSWAGRMERLHGWQWYRAPQNIVWMGSAYGITREWLLSGKLALNTCPVLRKAVASMHLYTGLTGLGMPVKARSRSNIDPLTALLMGCKVLNETSVMGESAYAPGRVVI